MLLNCCSSIMTVNFQAAESMAQEASKQGKTTSSSGKFASAQVNRLLQRYPQPPHTIRLKWLQLCIWTVFLYHLLRLIFKFQIPTHSPTCSLACSLSLSLTHTHARTHTRAHAPTHAHTHTHTHTHTLSLSLSLSLSLMHMQTHKFMHVCLFMQDTLNFFCCNCLFFVVFYFVCWLQFSLDYNKQKLIWQVRLKSYGDCAHSFCLSSADMNRFTQDGLSSMPLYSVQFNTPLLSSGRNSLFISGFRTNYQVKHSYIYLIQNMVRPSNHVHQCFEENLNMYCIKKN